MHLFGPKPDPEFFTVVTCDFCGMVLKPQALHEHILKRHNFSPLSEDVVMLNEYSAQTNEKPTVKKRKLNPGACLRVESQHLVSTQSMILKNPPSSIQYLQSTKSLDQFRMPPIRKLKMKLKKTTQGMWSVLPACWRIWDYSWPLDDKTYKWLSSTLENYLKSDNKQRLQNNLMTHFQFVNHAKFALSRSLSF